MRLRLRLRLSSAPDTRLYGLSLLPSGTEWAGSLAGAIVAACQCLPAHRLVPSGSYGRGPPVRRESPCVAPAFGLPTELESFLTQGGRNDQGAAAGTLPSCNCLSCERRAILTVAGSHLTTLAGSCSSRAPQSRSTRAKSRRKSRCWAPQAQSRLHRAWWRCDTRRHCLTHHCRSPPCRHVKVLCLLHSCLPLTQQSCGRLQTAEPAGEADRSSGGAAETACNSCNPAPTCR